MSIPETRHIFDESGCINQQMLLDYQNNRLSRSEKHSIEQHLVDCELCSDALEGLALIGSISVLNEVNEKVKGLTKNPIKPFISPRNKNYFLLAASVTIVAVSTYFVLNFKNSADQSLAETKTEKQTAEKPPAELTPIKEKEPAPVMTDSIIPDLTTKAAAKSLDIPVEKKPAGQPQLSVSANAGTFSSYSNQVTVPALPEQGIAADRSIGNSKRENETLDLSSDSVGFIPIEPQELWTLQPGNFSYNYRPSLDSQNIIFVSALAVYNYSKKVSDERKKDIASESSLEAPYETREEKESDKKQAVSKNKRQLTYEEKLSSAFYFFNNRDYQSALGRFGELLRENQHDINALFYSGQANENMLNYSKAIEFYNKVETNKDTEFFTEAARWHRALCLIQLNKSDEARTILNNLKTNNGFYNQKATGKLKQLK